MAEIDNVESRGLKWYGHITRMEEDRWHGRFSQ